MYAQVRTGYRTYTTARLSAGLHEKTGSSTFGTRANNKKLERNGEEEGTIELSHHKVRMCISDLCCSRTATDTQIHRYIIGQHWIKP